MLASFETEVLINQGPVELFEPFVSLVYSFWKDHDVCSPLVLQLEFRTVVLHAEKVCERFPIGCEFDHQHIQRVFLIPSLHQAV
jgi:hypothetical protein